MAESDRITRQTRQNILDWLRAENVNWTGRLDEEPFLDRITNLDALPSTDPRFQTARGDLIQHRVANHDWPDDWVYSYSPLSLSEASDDLFGKFLAEMLHPVVRPDSDEAARLAAELNDLLAPVVSP